MESSVRRPFTVGANTLTLYNAPAGTATNLVAGPTSSIGLAGASAGTLALPAHIIQLTNLTVDRTGAGASATLAASIDISGVLTLTNGTLITGANTVTMGSVATVARTNGYVNGLLRKPVSTGAATQTYEIGSASGYAPVALAFGAVTTPGTVTASVTAGDHPNLPSSTLDPSRSVNRYWTLVNGGIAFDRYSATFTFPAADVDVASPTSTWWPSDSS